MIGRHDCTKRRTTVFVDIDPATHNLNPGDIQRLIGFANQAIIPCSDSASRRRRMRSTRSRVQTLNKFVAVSQTYFPGSYLRSR